MEVWGVDFSTKQVDRVSVLTDSDEHVIWWRHPMEGSTLEDRIRYMNASVLQPSFGWVPAFSFPGRGSNAWDDVLAIGIERPIGKFSTDQLSMVLGALITRVPSRTLMKLWTPPAWKAACGMSGSAPKFAVRDWVATQLGDHPLLESQDACDAYAIAYATRAAVETVVTEDNVAAVDDKLFP